MGQLSEPGRQEIRERMAHLRGAEARAEARRLAAAWGLSEATVYRASREARQPKGRRTQGERQIEVSEEALSMMVALTSQTQMPATDVIEIAEGNGLIEPGAVNPAWLTRHLRANGMSRRQSARDPRPCRRFEASEPGELYQIDATVAEQYYIEDDGSVGWENAASRNKNRPGNEKQRLSLIGALDDHSRAAYAEFVTGLTVNHWLNFEFNCFRKKADGFEFHGIPRTVYMDNDAVAKNQKFIAAHRALGITIKKHKPTTKNDLWSNARSKGKIERFLGFLAEKQKRTKICKFRSLAEANEFLREVCREKNLARHGTTGDAPLLRWRRIRPEMLVQCDDDRLYELLYRDIIERTIYRDLTVRIDGDVWQLDYSRPFLDMINRKVTIYRHPREKSRIYLEWEGREYRVERQGQELRAWEDGPRAIAKPERQEQLEAAMTMDLSGLKMWGFDKGAEAGQVAYLPVEKQGVALDTSGLIAAAPRRLRVDAMLAVAGELGRPLRAAESAHLAASWGEWVTDEEIETGLAELRAPVMQEANAG